jgi:hypothetical protein
VFQETIKTTQIRRFDGHLRRRRQLAVTACQLDHGLGRKRLVARQQTPQRFIHGGLALVGGVLQNPQIATARLCGTVFVAEPIIGHAETAVGKEVLAIAVVLEGPGLTHQLVDDVPVVDGMLVASHEPRQRIDLGSRKPDFHTVGIQPGFDLVADQATVHRVGIAVDVDQTAAVDVHRQAQATLLPLGRQRPQQRPLLGQPWLPVAVASVHDPLEKLHVVLDTVEVAAAAQIQGLIDRGLEMAMRRFIVAVLVRLANIDALAAQAVVFEQASITGLKFAFDRQIVDCRGEAVAAMPFGNATELPQGVLQTVRQGLEGLRGADGHRFPVRVGEHEVIHQMIEAFAEDGDSQSVHAGKVRGGQIAGEMHLAEHDGGWLPGGGAPMPDAAFEGAALARGQLSGTFGLQPIEQGFGVQARFRMEPCFDLRPQVRQRVLTRPIGPRLFERTGKHSQLAVFASGLLVHVGPPSRHCQTPVLFQVSKQLPYLPVADHCKPPVYKGVAIMVRA